MADGAGRPLPLGVPGDLWAPGGHGRPTATGARARRLPDGWVELLTDTSGGGGRLPAWEIEALLRRDGAVRQVRAVPVRRAGSRWGLVALVEPTADAAGDDGLEGRLDGIFAELVPVRDRPRVVVLGEDLERRSDGSLDAESSAGPGAAFGSVAAPRDALERDLVRVWEELFGVSPLGIDEDFFALGGNSLLGVRLLAAVGSRFGRDLDLSRLLQARTVEALAAVLRGDDGAGGAGTYQPQVLLRAGDGGSAPLFLVHPGGGNVLCYEELARHLPGDRPVYGLQARGREAGEEPFEDVDEMVDAYLAAVRDLRPRGPYHLAGWSFGGLVAFEMARRLLADGDEVALLALLDTRLRSGHEERSEEELVEHLLGEELPLPAAELLGEGDADVRLRKAVAAAKEAGLLPADYPPEKAHRLFEVRRHNIRMGERWQPAPYPGNVHLLRAEERADEAADDPTFGWEPWAGSVSVVEVPGNHQSLVRSPHVRTLAKRLGDLLAAGD